MSAKANGKAQVYAVEMRPLAKVTPYPANAKAHSEEAVAKLARLIERYGGCSLMRLCKLRNPSWVHSHAGLAA